MKSLLEKMDRLAGDWLHALESQLRQPLLRAATGAVFRKNTRQCV